MYNNSISKTYSILTEHNIHPEYIEKNFNIHQNGEISVGKTFNDLSGINPGVNRVSYAKKFTWLRMQQLVLNKNLLNVTKLPVKFREVSGTMDVSHFDLESFENFPEIVNGELIVNRTKIRSMEHSPRIINGSFTLTDNLITTLEGGPTFIDDTFHIDKINNLRKIDGFTIVGNVFSLGRNKIESIENIDKHLEFSRPFGKLTLWPSSLDYITGGLLSLLKVKNLCFINMNRYSNDFDKPLTPIEQAIDIISKRTGEGRSGILRAQNELIERGLAEFAKF